MIRRVFFLWSSSTVSELNLKITYIFICDVFVYCLHDTMIWNVLYENGSCGFYFIKYNLKRYFYRNINAIGFLFLTTPLLYVFWCLTRAGYRRYKVRYPVGFKTATSSGRSVQIVQNRYLCRRVLPLFICPVR